MTVWRWLVYGLVVLLLLAACTAVPDSTPTPVQSVAEVATLIVERPSATPLPTLTPTLQPTITSEPVATDEMLRATAVPTFTRIPLPTPDPFLRQVAVSDKGNITNVIVSSLGQWAFIQDDSLWVETMAGSGGFGEIGRYAQTAAWSADGSKLVYSLANMADTFDNPDVAFEQWLWSTKDGNNVSLSELVASYPNPAFHVFDIFWSPDSTKILLWAALDERHEKATFIMNDSLLVVVNLTQNTLSDVLFVSNDRPVWLTNEVFVIRDHCGSPCAFYRAYNYSNELIWEFGWRTGGFVDFASEGNFMINVGRSHHDTRHNDPQPPATVDEINLTTGEWKVIWQKPREEGYFNPFFMPELSTDEQFISFNYGNPRTVYVIDRNGREYWQYANSHVVDWRSSNELTVCEMLGSGASQLVHLTLVGEAKIIFTTEPGTEISHCSWDINGGGKWSPDGRFFIFTTEDRDEETAQLYLWHPDNGEVRLIQSLKDDRSFYDLTWLPDSTAFYFTSGELNRWLDAIWWYAVQTAE
jgi:hypothetical protein